MHVRTLQPTSRRARSSVLALWAALCLTLLLSTAAFANTVEIYDNARVLNSSQVQSDASSLSDPIRIYTFPSYSGTVSQFNNQAVLSENTSKTIVIAINSGARYVYIAGGKDAGLNSSDYNNAVSAFKNNFNGNYTNATIAAIDSLKSKLGSGFSINPVLGALCCVGLLVLVVFGVFGALRRRGRGNAAPVYNAPVGYGPQNYGAPQQGGGMNPWVAGGLGAAGGGFLGYELGKAEGEREARREMQGGFGGDQGGFGGGAGGFFGGGGGGFGGDQGGFGGGAGGSFGGDQGGFGGGGGFGGDQGGGFGGGGGNESLGGFSGGDSNNNNGGGSSF